MSGNFFIFNRKQKMEKKINLGYSLINFILLIFICIYSNLFLRIQKPCALFTIQWQVIVILIFLILIMPICNNLITFPLLRKLLFYKTHQSSGHKKELLIRQLKSFPSRKTLHTNLQYMSFLTIISLCYYFFYHYDIKFIIVNFLIQTNVIYIASLIVFRYTEFMTKIAISAIMNELQGTRHYERVSDPVNSIKSLFVFFVVIPLIFCAISIAGVMFLSKSYLIYHTAEGAFSTFDLSLKELDNNFNYQLLSQKEAISSMISVTVINFLLLTLSVFLYINKLSIYLFKMGKALTAISIGNITKVKLFPVDLNTEISHTMYLLNKIILIFRKIHEKTDSANIQIKDSGDKLSKISSKTQDTLNMQKNSINEIINTINQASEVSQNIKENLSEVSNIARKTLSTAQSNFTTFSENISKIQEITDSNQTTISEIEQLSSKILGIHDIITLIDSLAEQTKIVAFNAELVANSINSDNENLLNVSKEIRQLAETTIELTGKAKEKVQEIQDSSEGLLKTGEDCMHKIHEGNTLSEKLSTHFASIRDAASKNVNDTSTIMTDLDKQKEYFNYMQLAAEKTEEKLNEFENTSRIITDTINDLQNSSASIENMSFNINKRHLNYKGDMQ
ncbi:methyl-accepting chemotaxis protein [Treponema sp.]|uniref:methyl-accepting chemotaxis protein n=1 Tax=Treponema sp. TaxID=166 RepID=UPI0025F78448|nr:methyl-accepting chemotaxis protein [Treponema sp.]MCR5218506.1 methyl-accepting chemotaxis protein [Treponema sp.]